MSVILQVYCKSGRCTSCQCSKAGLRCTAMCGQCRGLYCGNAEEIEIADEGNDDLDDIDTPWNIHGIEYTGIEVVL